MASQSTFDNKFDDELEQGYYSELQVLLSGNGYYIGTLYHDPEGYSVPGSRDSVEYFPTAILAEEALRAGTWTRRNIF